jgi:hypothetical protein
VRLQLWAGPGGAGTAERDMEGWGWIESPSLILDKRQVHWKEGCWALSSRGIFKLFLEGFRS